MRDIIQSQNYEKAKILQKQLVETSKLSLGSFYKTAFYREMALSDIYIIREMLPVAANILKHIILRAKKPLGDTSEIYREGKLRLV